MFNVRCVRGGAETAPTTRAQGLREAATKRADDESATQKKSDEPGEDRSGGVSLMAMTNNKGEIVANLVVTGKEMSFDGQQRLIRGPGYLQATEGHHFQLIAAAKHSDPLPANGISYIQVSLSVTLIAWDNEGTATTVEGIEPYVENSYNTKFKVIGKPSLRKGVLTLQLEGKRQLFVRPRFWHSARATGNVDFLFAKPQ